MVNFLVKKLGAVALYFLYLQEINPRSVFFNIFVSRQVSLWSMQEGKELMGLEMSLIFRSCHIYKFLICAKLNQVLPPSIHPSTHPPNESSIVFDNQKFFNPNFLDTSLNSCLKK
jgi:hypothetical protein